MEGWRGGEVKGWSRVRVEGKVEAEMGGEGLKGRREMGIIKRIFNIRPVKIPENKWKKKTKIYVG